MTERVARPHVVDIARVFKEERGRAVATLIRHFGDIDVAEEAVQDAFVIATERWPTTGLPPNPGAWITTTAKNRAVDRHRRETKRRDKHATAVFLEERDEPLKQEEGPVHDDQLRLLFTCCHPSLATSAQVALTLRLIAGLETPEIARAFLLPEATLAQRLVRAKRKIKAAGIPYRVPDDEDVPGRLRSVLAVVYLVFNEGYTASSGDVLVRGDLCDEGIRLARLLVQLMPEEPEVRGLLALFLLLDARRPARTAPDGSLVRLPDQDRTLWRRALLVEGQAIVRACLERNEPGPYQIQAAIQAVHSDAVSARDTDWGQILQLYDLLLLYVPSPVVALNRAVVVAEVHGAEAALVLVDALDLPRYPLLYATRAELLCRVGKHRQALEAYDQALALTENATERKHLEERRHAAAAELPV